MRLSPVPLLPAVRAAGTAAAVVLGGLSHAAAEPGAPDWHADIAPLLRQYCAGCHNDVDYEGDFTVERFADFLEGGSKGSPVEPGDPDKSLLVRLMTGGTRKPMPPVDEPQPSAAEIDTFRAWIASGADGPAPGDDASILASLEVPDLPAAPGAKPATAVAASPDGSRMALAWSRSVRATDLATGQPVLRDDDLPGKVTALHFSADGRRLVAATGIAGLRGTAVAWDLATGRRMLELGEGTHRDILYDAEFSPDGRTLATAGYDRRIALWDLAAGELVRTIDVHNGAVFDLAFSPDGSVLASASADQTVKLWRVADGARLDTLNQPEAGQLAVAFTPDGRHIVAAGADHRIRLWRFVSRESPALNPLVHARFAHEDTITGLAISPDGRLLASAADDRTIKLWTLPSLAPADTFPDQPDVAAALAFTSGASLTVARLDGSTGAFPTPLGTAGDEVRASPEASPAGASPASIPPFEERSFSGTLDAPGRDALHAFDARAGEAIVLEIEAARSGSPLDSTIEVLDASGEPVPRVVLQEVRSSWLTFRGKDSATSADFRLHNWEEMELNEYLFLNGEVVKLWLYPRGPDSGFVVYPGVGNRQTYFGTTALAHPLGQPCAIVRPFPPGATPPPNGLPVHTLYFENDDDPARRLGSDSHLVFTAPRDGEYLARVTDTRGFGGGEFRYTLHVRPAKPDFAARIEGLKDPAVSPGSGKEFVVQLDRFDDFEGEVRVDVSGLPPGFTASTPVVVEAGHRMAMGVLTADRGALAPAAETASTSRITATAVIAGETVTREVGSFGTLTLAEPPPVLVSIRPDGDSGSPRQGDDGLLELSIRPGETIQAVVRAERLAFDGRIEFGTEDAGRNLPHGVIVANIGLNGLMIPEGRSEQTFFLAAAPWVPASTRLVHLRTKNAGSQATTPVRLHVLPADETGIAGSP